MVWSNVRVCGVLELAVMLFQVFGVAALCLNRLLPASRWADRGRIGAIVALFGLGVAGALCGRHASEFALFAGGTMTVLLIGMTTGSGSGQNDSRGDSRGLMTAEPNLAG
jgi:uncharacterized membrane protein YhaH (DUF805 family)